MFRTAIILGTRPQIIKSAPVYHAFRKAGLDCGIINTGQHYDYEMNREFFSELELPDPLTDLNVGQGTPNEQLAGIISGLDKVFESDKPDVAIVPGDTNSALAAGIACSKAGVPVAHLESGCRSGDSRMAEEVNRRLLDHMSNVLLCPTAGCVKNVRSERVLADVVENTGDTMFDSLLRYEKAIDGDDVRRKYGTTDAQYAFMTLHRAETVDDPRTLANVLAAVGSAKTRVLFSVHPRTRARIDEFGSNVPASVKLLDPLPYLDTLALVKGSQFVITDSGGLQKEAYWLGKPTLITRDRTEWIEIVKAGASFLVGTSREGIAKGIKKLPTVSGKSFSRSKRIFGSGHASEKVAKVLERFGR